MLHFLTNASKQSPREPAPSHHSRQPMFGSRFRGSAALTSPAFGASANRQLGKSPVTLGNQAVLRQLGSAPSPGRTSATLQRKPSFDPACSEYDCCLVIELMAVPAFHTAITDLQSAASQQVRQGWSSLSAGERILAVTSTTMIGAGVLAGIVSNDQARQSALGLLSSVNVPVIGVPGLTFRLNATGQNPSINFGYTRSF